DRLGFPGDFLQRRLHDQFESRDPDHDFHGPVRIGDTDYPVRMQWNLRGRLHPLRPGPQDDLPVARGAEYPRDPPVHVARAEAALLARAFRTPGDGPRAWALNGEAHRSSLIDGFDRLLAWPTLRGVVRYPHQERTCLRVLREMRGRAILADEVGLGKTIETGLLLKEYTIRGLVRRALILTPASLTRQWREEVESKFALPFAVLRSLGGGEP